MDICDHFYGATLTTIHSQQEFDFIRQMLFDWSHAKYSVWIGLIRITNESFIWFDKSPLDYTNWGPNEPNNWHSKNYCTVMSSALSAKGQWFDVGCTTTYLVMCQKYLHKSTDTTKVESILANMSVADQINMQLDREDGIQNYSLYSELKSLAIKTNANIVFITILFVLLIILILKNNYKFVLIGCKSRENRSSNLDNDFNTSTEHIAI
ncbi:macrophage mannose receptor 1-like [Oppia nitens]|uniref:macrophage mannose receptor 1-like n=1 Tax=Oppia nitens TaxID=1686743 RepID=UPI0023DBC13E|nr:macrophage mannose receptor 1-like [Oppia nitens]